MKKLVNSPLLVQIPMANHVQWKEKKSELILTKTLQLPSDNLIVHIGSFKNLFGKMTILYINYYLSAKNRTMKIVHLYHSKVLQYKRP